MMATILLFSFTMFCCLVLLLLQLLLCIFIRSCFFFTFIYFFFCYFLSADVVPSLYLSGLQCLDNVDDDGNGEENFNSHCLW